MKLVLDIEEQELHENDIIIFKNGRWEIISKNSFLAEISKEHNLSVLENEKRFERLEKDLVELAKIVKEK